MSPSSAWLARQLHFRLGRPEDAPPSLLTADAVAACGAIPHIAVYNGRARRFDPVNHFDRLCLWNDDSGQFEQGPRQPGRPLLGRRQARFGNLLHAWGFEGSFVTNWCDGQGWDYPERLPGLGDNLVLQYARRRSQRGQVALMPLDHAFMGPGSPNLPILPDPLPFADKTDTLCWRGRFSGTLSDWRQAIWWAESVFEPRKAAVDQTESCLQIQRLQVARALRGWAAADVRLTASPKERAALASQPWLDALLGDVLAPRLSMDQQRRSKFLLVVDGNDIGTNKYWSLLSNSVVLMVASEWETALDEGLEPGVHYVPVQADRGSIEAAMDALLADPDRCQNLIANAHAHLLPQLDPALRDAADYATLRRYQDQVLPVAHLPQAWSLARS